jgi:glycosyltransferase involved in cell wall biosynthesis
MPTTPHISVVVDTYQQGAFLAEAVESVLAQDVEHPVEVIVVDDGSTDGTTEILARYAQRVTVIRQENQGQAAALNTGIAAASGEWVAFLDGDDRWAAGYLSRVAERIAAEPDADALFGAVRRISASGAATADDPPDHVLRQLQDLCTRSDAAREGLYPWFPPTSAIAARRQTLVQIGPIPREYRLNADGWLQMALAVAARRPLWEPQRLVELRIHASNRWSADRHDDPAIATRRRELYERLAADVGSLAARCGRNAAGLERALRAQAAEFGIWEHILHGRRARALAAAVRWEPPPWMGRPSERAFKRLHTVLATLAPVDVYIALRRGWQESVFARLLSNGGEK